MLALSLDTDSPTADDLRGEKFPVDSDGNAIDKNRLKNGDLLDKGTGTIAVLGRNGLEFFVRITGIVDCENGAVEFIGKVLEKQPHPMTPLEIYSV